MIPKHTHFALLCVLAELDQLSSPETIEFREHCKTCVSCRQYLRELTRLHATLAVTNRLRKPDYRVPSGMTRRFIARANREGVSLEQRAPAIGSANLALASVVLIVLLLAGTLLGRAPITPSPVPAVQAELANPTLYRTAATKPKSVGAKQPAPRVTRRINSHLRVGADPSPLLSSPSPNSLTDDAVSHADIYPARADVAQAKGFNQSPETFRFQFLAPQGIAGRKPEILTACLCAPLAPLSSRTSFALASAPLFQAEVHAYKATLKPDFRADPTTFQFIEGTRQ